MLTELQKKTSQAVVNIFETGSVRGNYGGIAVLPGDTGHLSYGRSQASLGSGSLYALIQSYCDAPGALYASQLSPYLGRMQQKDVNLDADAGLRQFLRSAGTDPVMCRIQDDFFDHNYWDPAMQASAALSIQSALGSCVIYDSFIQGAFGLIRNKVLDALGRMGSNLTEQRWISTYVQQRKEWLANSPNPALPPTVYRMQTFEDLIAAGSWDLPLPITIRGVVIDSNCLGGQGASTRVLQLTQPYASGDDVRAVQQALVRNGFSCAADGVFGPQTEQAVRAFQSAHGVASDGIVGPKTLSALGLARTAQTGT